MATKKRSSPAPSRAVPARKQGTALVPIKPVPEKIGESRGNLKARERAFQNRRGGRAKG